MDYIRQLEAFERRLINCALPVRSQLLWYKLLGMYTKCGFGEWISLGNEELMSVTNIASKATFIAAREELIRGGFIEYHRGNRGSCGHYRMVRLFEADAEAENANSKNEPYNKYYINNNIKKNNKLINNNYINNNKYVSQSCLSQSVEDIKRGFDVGEEIRQGLTEGKIFDYICTIVSEVCLMPAVLRNGENNMININKGPMAVSNVQEVYKALDGGHIEHVIDNFKGVRSVIKNKRAYFQTALFNAVKELDVHYINLVKCDGGGCDMLIKDYLQQAFTVDRMVRAIQTQIDDLEEKRLVVSHLALSWGKVPVGINHVKFNELSVKYLDLIEEYEHELLRLLEVKEEIKAMIDGLSNPVHRLVMTERYINLKRWEEIAEDTGYDYDYLRGKMHKKILKKIERVHKRLHGSVI